MEAIWNTLVKAGARGKTVARGEKKVGPVGPIGSDRLTAGLDAGGVGIWYWDIASGGQVWSKTMEALHALEPHAFPGTYAAWQKLVHPDDRAVAFKTIQQALDHGEPFRIEYRLVESGGAPLWREMRGEAVRERGAVVAATGTAQDITERKETERAALERERQQETVSKLGLIALREAPIQSLFDAVAIEVCQVLGVEYCKLLEVMPDGHELLLRAGYGWKEGLVGRTRLPTDKGSQAGYTLKVDHAVVVEDLATETRFESPKLLHDHGVVSGLSVIVMGEDNRPFGTLSAHTTRRRRFRQSDLDFLQAIANTVAIAIQRNEAAHRQRLLMRELRHRVGNLLTLVISLFNNSARSAESVEELSEKFLARVMSLSRAHTHISYMGWSTAGFSRLVREVLEPFLDHIRLEGEDVRIGADSAFALSLAMHELLTNAAKHGGLSTENGGLAVRWRIEGEGDGSALDIRWEEEAGLPGRSEIARPDGFGSRLVRTVIEDQLGGSYQATFRPKGFLAEIRLPLARLER